MSDIEGLQTPNQLDWLLGDGRGRPRPETLDLAMDAWERGQSALAAGDLKAARYWAERAARLGPHDTQVRFLLGIVQLRQQDRSAYATFRKLVAASNTVPAYRGLVAAAALVGGRDALTQAAGTLLSRFAPPVDTEFPALSARIAAAAGLAGWCGADAAGRVTVSAMAQPSFALDDRTITARRRPDGRWGLPASWTTARALTVTVDGRALLGSPIDLERRRAVEGFVEAADGGLRGWAWCPADPDAAVRLTLHSILGRLPPIDVDAKESAQVPDMDGLMAPKSFHVPADRVRDRPGLVHLRDSSGRDLTGSPLDPGLWTGSAFAAARLMAQGTIDEKPARARQPALLSPPIVPIWADTPPPARRTIARRSRLGPAVVVPVYRGVETTLACLSRVLETVPARTPVIVVDDAGPEPELSAALDELARTRQIQLVRNPRNIGFPASANVGVAAAGARDVVLLNSDTMVPPGWLERLRDAAWSAPDIGTVTPLSNDATILSYPRVDREQPPPEAKMLDRIDRLAAKANGGSVVDIPTSVGFCMYVRCDCLAETGRFRQDVFAQGYGEENDFCLRARHLGWRHVAATGIFVGHVGGQSFRTTREHLLRRNLTLLERLHPGYHDLIARHVAADPLADARHRLDLARWRGLRAGRAKGEGGAVILITHDEGGGVERQIKARVRALVAQGQRPIILRPATDGRCLVELGAGDEDVWRSDFPNLRYRIPEQLPELASLLRRERPDHVELHHQLGHHHDLLSLPALLGVPMDVFIHDYATICPRVTLVTTSNRYCGEPEAWQCEACIADLGSRLREDISVTALRRRTAADLAAARQVVCPSADTEKRLRRYVPRLRSGITPWAADAPLLDRPGERRRETPANRRRRVAIIGAIGTEKGYDVILECARDAARRNLPLEFVVIGYTHDDMRLIDTGRAQVTYRFAPEMAVAEITAQEADIAFIPSIWPETWCFALSDAWAAGLNAAVFDIGTQAERVRATNNGWVLPLALPPLAINNTLIALAETQS
jgi:GT2 family glycosyltransferase/glycosyltransferase involved in cell wall biosynthesis